MRVWVLIFLAALLASPVLAADTTPVVRLRAEVAVRGNAVRWMDLADGPIDSDLGRTVVFHAPAPGVARTWTRVEILRESVRRGLAPVPRLEGADAVEVRREGRAIAPDEFRHRVDEQLRTIAVDEGVIAQRFEVLRLPGLRLEAADYTVRVAGPAPRVGRGSVAIEVIATGGSRRTVFVSVNRSLQIVAARTRRASSARQSVDFATVSLDTLWIDDLRLVDNRIGSGDLDGSWSLTRSVEGGRVLTRGDVRPTPVVHRSESVDWIVERGGLRIVLHARARNDGAIGEWITIQSPLDGQLRRVCVVAPGIVSDHLPDPDSPIGAARVEPRGEAR